MTSSHSSSTSSSESTSSSGSSSCSDTGSTTTDTDSSSSCENKPNTSTAKNNEAKSNNKSSQATNLRRKSCENKLSSNAKPSEIPEKANLKTKTPTANTITPQKQTKSKVLSQNEDATANRKQAVHSTATTTTKSIEVHDKTTKTNKSEKEKTIVLSAESDVSEKNPTPKKVKTADTSKNAEGKASANTTTTSTTTTATATATQNRGRPPPKSRSTNAQTSIKPITNSSTKRKSSIESNCDSASEVEYVSCSSSVETDNDSDSSYSTKTRKGKRSKRTSKARTNAKRTNSETDEGQHPQQNFGNRKLTRSFSSRHNERHLKSNNITHTRNTNLIATLPTDTDSDAESIKDIKHHLSKSPVKKPYVGPGSTYSKSKSKKDCNNYGLVKNRMMSPIQIEKKCPIEGCDSSGHLSGHLDRHFLPEACPIYHNMSVSECKERANERKLRQEIRTKPAVNSNNHDDQNGRSASTSKYLQTADQKEFLNNIRESRIRFKPIAEMLNSDKINLEKDCNDKDREPSLVGLVPDYDLQLFREAQALASETIEEDLKDLPIGKGIKYITMGKYKMKVWYQSPYPEDVARLPQMYICEFCLRYQKSETGIKRHAQKCVWRHPPGDEIYRKGKLQVWQVDGKRHKQYCQHLCLLAKFFLDHKTLYYDVEPFLFYIMTLADLDGCHTVGYFSKEKNSFYNVSCILTLPPYQRKGYGRLLIDFSYLLTRVEGKIGSPEKPLSDLGLISYRSYWKDVLLDYLCNRSGNTLSIKDVSQEMAIYSYDIVSTLQALGMMKYWKGKHIVLKKQDVLDEYEERVKRRGTFPKIDESCLRWIPFVPTQTNNSP